MVSHEEETCGSVLFVQVKSDVSWGKMILISQIHSWGLNWQ